MSPGEVGGSSGVSTKSQKANNDYLLKGAGEPGEEAPATSGALTSPNYPQRYPNDAKITDTITVPRGNIIIMQFTEFDVESGRYDYVVITDGQNSYDNRDGTRLAKFDGNSPRLGGWDLDEDGRRHPRGWANRITSSTETVTVTFITDGSVTRKGWRLEWSEYKISWI